MNVWDFELIGVDSIHVAESNSEELIVAENLEKMDLRKVVVMACAMSQHE